MKKFFKEYYNKNLMDGLKGQSKEKGSSEYVCIANLISKKTIYDKNVAVAPFFAQIIATYPVKYMQLDLPISRYSGLWSF